MPYKTRRARKGRRKSYKGWGKRAPRKTGHGDVIYRKLKLMVEDTVAAHTTPYDRVLDIQVAMNDPSPSADYAGLQGLYEEFRVSACKIQWVPQYNTEVPGTTYSFGSGVSYMDFNSTSSWISYPSIVPYNTMKLHNMYRPWSRYIRLPKLPTSASEPSGWQTTTSGGTSVGFFGATTPGYAAGLSVGTIIGYHLITWYCKFRKAK